MDLLKCGRQEHRVQRAEKVTVVTLGLYDDGGAGVVEFDLRTLHSETLSLRPDFVAACGQSGEYVLTVLIRENCCGKRQRSRAGRHIDAAHGLARRVFDDPRERRMG